MNKNKVLFIIIVVALALFLGFLFKTLSGDSGSPTSAQTGWSWEVNIWTLWGDTIWVQALLESFKQSNPRYTNVVFNVQNFSDYGTYIYTLSSAISKNQAPDIFVLNNNDKSIFADHSVSIPSDIINASDFRKKYKAVFGEDLIASFWEDGEFVSGVPLGYESLGIFYNRKFVQSSELSSQAALSSIVSSISQKYDDKIGIALWNGSSIVDAVDIITQYFLLSWIDHLEKLDDKTIKTAMETYFRYGSDGSDNWYDSDVFVDLLSTGRNNLDLFSQGDLAMVVGYPRMLQQISEKWYSKKFLLASPFPHYVWESGQTLINYNYFAVNKDSLQTTLAYNLLAYMTTETAVEAYLKNYSYYLPALLSLESQFLSQKLDESYNISLWDFYNSDYELSSFNKSIKTSYDREMIAILDNAPSYKALTQQLQNSLLCQSKKIHLFENLSAACE